MIPPRTILAPVDFSEPSRTALATAGRLARQTGAALIVVYAENPLMAEAARLANVDLAADTARELDQFIAGTPAAAAVSPRRHAGTGQAVDVVVDAVREYAADLVVIGSHGISGPTRLVFGSTTEGVLRKSPASVLMTPAAWSPAQPTAADMAGTGPVIAAVDFHPESLAAAKAACRLAATLKTDVNLLHVVGDVVARAKWQPHAEAVIRDRVAEARAQLESLAQTLASPVPVSTRVETGDVATELARVAAPTEAAHPVLILGRKAAGQRDGAPGAIAYRVLMLAKTPVLVHVAD